MRGLGKLSLAPYIIAGNNSKRDNFGMVRESFETLKYADKTASEYLFSYPFCSAFTSQIKTRDND
jgi:hypothetical protein